MSVLDALRSQVPAGITAGLLSLALLSTAGAVAMERKPVAPTVLLRSAVILMFLAVGPLVWKLEGLRTWMLNDLQGIHPPVTDVQDAWLAGQELGAVRLAGFAFGLVILCVTAASLRVAACRSVDGRTRLAIAAAGLLTATAALGAAWYAHAALLQDLHEGAEFAQLNLGCFDRLGQLRVLLIGIAGIAFLGLAALRRPLPNPGPRAPASATLFFLVGLSAFGLTRSRAQDAQHWLPPFEGDELVYVPHEPLPTLAKCQPLPLSAVVFDESGQWVIDGEVVSSPGKLLERLGDMRGKMMLLHSMADAGSYEFSVDLVAPAKSPASEVRPFIDAIEDAGIPINVVAERRTVIQSRTRGGFVRHVRCARRLGSPGTGDGPDAGTWGDIAARR
jgi:hypothetical protein